MKLIYLKCHELKPRDLCYVLSLNGWCTLSIHFMIRKKVTPKKKRKKKLNIKLHRCLKKADFDFVVIWPTTIYASSFRCLFSVLRDRFHLYVCAGRSSSQSWFRHRFDSLRFRLAEWKTTLSICFHTLNQEPKLIRYWNQPWSSLIGHFTTLSSQFI